MNLPIRRTTGRSGGGMSAIVAVEEAGAAPGGRPDAAGEDGSEGGPASSAAFLEAPRVRTGHPMPGSIEIPSLPSVTKRKALHPTDDDGRGPMTMAGSCVTAAALTKTYIHETTTTTEHGETERSGAGRRSGAERSGAGRRTSTGAKALYFGSRESLSRILARVGPLTALRRWAQRSWIAVDPRTPASRHTGEAQQSALVEPRCSQASQWQHTM